MKLITGSLPEDIISKISDGLKELEKDYHEITHSQELDVAMYVLENDSTFDVALECLEDARRRFTLLRISLIESQACISYFRKFSSNAPNESGAIFFGKYYLDYAALLMYAIGEDFADFIVNFLEAKSDYDKFCRKEKNIKNFKRKKISSNAAKVGLFIRKNFPDHIITRTIVDLKNNKQWKASIEYRNTWVHSKPPLVKDLDPGRRRESIVEQGEGFKTVTLGENLDSYDYSIEELLAICISGFNALLSVFSIFRKLIIERKSKFVKDSQYIKE